jgi:hypothetical protein
MGRALLKIIVALGAALLGYKLLKNDEEKEKPFSISRASNCHDIFLQFSKSLTLTPSKKQKLIQARTAIKNKLCEYFKGKSGLEIPKSWIQGSYKMGTIIRNRRDTCDVDMGLYFFKKPELEAKTYLQNVARALSDHTAESVVIKNKCVRVVYQGDYHIDIPVYYRDIGKNSQYLATKENGWESSDPKLFWDWFKKKTRDKPQLVRIIKYAKAWLNDYGSKAGRKVPSGLALTIWYIKNYVPHKRDDASFFYSSINLLEHLGGSVGQWICIMPVRPGDDLIIKLDHQQRRNFKEGLKAMIDEAAEAVTTNSKEEAIQIWKVILGRWFPSEF